MVTLHPLPSKGSFTFAAAVCGFRSGLRQRRDRNFSISAEQHNHLLQMHMENAVMWMSLKAQKLLLYNNHAAVVRIQSNVKD